MNWVFLLVILVGLLVNPVKADETLEAGCTSLRDWVVALATVKAAFFGNFLDKTTGYWYLIWMDRNSLVLLKSALPVSEEINEGSDRVVCFEAGGPGYTRLTPPSKD